MRVLRQSRAARAMVLDGRLDGIPRATRHSRRQICHSHEREEPFGTWNSQSHAGKLVETRAEFKVQKRLVARTGIAPVFQP